MRPPGVPVDGRAVRDLDPLQIDRIDKKHQIQAVPTGVRHDQTVEAHEPRGIAYGLGAVIGKLPVTLVLDAEITQRRHVGKAQGLAGFHRQLVQPVAKPGGEDRLAREAEINLGARAIGRERGVENIEFARAPAAPRA